MTICGRCTLTQPADVIYADIAKRARQIDAYIVRMEMLFTQGLMSERDLLVAYGGAILSFHSYTENAIERLFLGLVAGRLQHGDRRVRSLVEIRSALTVRKVVFGARSYADWLPYDRYTIPKAEAFLSAGRPFSSLSRSERTHLDDMTILRNALAHQSSHAENRFHDRFTRGKALVPVQRKPQGYLRGYHAVSQTRLNYLMGRSVHILSNLCH
jgi:hypothetical protein